MRRAIADAIADDWKRRHERFQAATAIALFARAFAKENTDA